MVQAGGAAGGPQGRVDLTWIDYDPAHDIVYIMKMGSDLYRMEREKVSAPQPEGRMPLRDHFHPPLYPQCAWESFHWCWANSIADDLHRVLPQRYFAEVHVHLGGQVEGDVAEFRGNLT